MTASLRLLAVALFVAAPLTASATSQGHPGTDLDRLSESGNIGNGAIILDDEAQTGASGPVVQTENVMPPDLPPTTTPVPVDGGLSLLALAGAGYAAKRLRARRA